MGALLRVARLRCVGVLLIVARLLHLGVLLLLARLGLMGVLLYMARLQGLDVLAYVARLRCLGVLRGVACWPACRAHACRLSVGVAGDTTARPGKIIASPIAFLVPLRQSFLVGAGMPL